ncbi:MAG: hypothetical protein Q8916_10555 [Bacteroidota bacterium]|nr:hypothetical protein [Bacteroidota bacterium]MDP4230829.1 hypothetical protein [Bacteroidota bacterium]MDP4237818.1 hypothetical protein [Bacteroidota bacterium]
MRKIHLLLSLMIVCGYGYAVAAPIDSVSKIRTLVRQIDSERHYITRTLENDEFMGGTDNGSSLTGYYKDGRLVKIAEWVGLSHCILTTEFYLDGGKPIFVYLQERSFPYLVPGDSFDYDHPEIVLEARYYFRKGKLIRKNSKGAGACSAGEFDVADLLKSFQRDSQLLKKRK